MGSWRNILNSTNYPSEAGPADVVGEIASCFRQLSHSHLRGDANKSRPSIGRPQKNLC